MAQAPDRTHSTTADTLGGSLPTAPKKGKGRWKLTAVLLLVVLPLAAFAMWVTATLTFSYASGDRAGYVQKLSNKGWVCKTWEGELAMANGPNVSPEIFPFSVRDGAVAAQINAALGKQVKITYEQHKGVPTSCFGETEYYVTRVDVLNGPTVPSIQAGAPAVVPAPAQPAPAPAVP